MPRQFSGDRLRAARLAAGLRPEQVAVAIDRSAYTIAEYEHGRARPSVAVLARLADWLRVPTDEFFVVEPSNTPADVRGIA